MGWFEDPDAAKRSIKGLFEEGVHLWGAENVPVRFSENRDLWDFEIRMMARDDCQDGACTLASAFFPDPGRHSLDIYPFLFKQSKEELVETMAHELGHVFGLRHFFAQVKERRWASELFGEHSPFSIMNYGEKSRMTEADKDDLRRLYELVWRRELNAINGTPVVRVRPYHTLLRS